MQSYGWQTSKLINFLPVMRGNAKFSATTLAWSRVHHASSWPISISQSLTGSNLRIFAEVKQQLNLEVISP